MDATALVIIALGSNLGEPRRNILRAIDRLRQFSDEPLRVSSLWQTSPVDCPPDSPVFVNAVVALAPRSGETPELLLPRMQALEKEFGRQAKKTPNESRPLDLDLIAFGGEVRHGVSLTLPHPRACVRRFVLQPLAEVLPGLILPGGSRTVFEMLADLPPDPGVVRLP
jgi:2-amino-4-hydroxy-6-hydroxymethyldihydropteridine diphosphokinase